MYASLSIFLLLSILPTYEEIVYSKGINYKFTIHHIDFSPLCQGKKRRPPLFRGPRIRGQRLRKDLQSVH